MPVKWTAENDHLLLLTLLETHNIKVDGEKIKAAWPSNGGEVPTARAIRERIVKIRSLSGSNINSPAKSPASHVNNGVKKESSPKKRGRPRQTKGGVDQDDEEIISQSFSKGNANGSFASTVQDDADVTPTPSPRKRRAVKVKTEPKMKFESETSDVVDLESSGDDFVPTRAEMEDDEDDEYLGD
ncbi:hypothetical protein TWF481_008020 [Arthrobotrys musiformis]|uniref:Uncharacterized protein n=1 Tax=Arthrobotrys musiformis TaxID=47236 RepID=A0AAV9W5X5_9PEZI